MRLGSDDLNAAGVQFDDAVVAVGMMANPHWPVWAARELHHADPFELVPEDCGWWLRNFRAHESCIGWPVVKAQEVAAPVAAAPEVVAPGAETAGVIVSVESEPLPA